MKVYIWVNPYKVSYDSSLVVAVAPNLREARKQAAKGKLMKYGEFEYPSPECILGKPDRVLATPIAEWYDWLEY